MFSATIKQRLREPAYLDLHLAAVAAVGTLGPPPFYDAHFLRCFAAAKTFLGNVRPDALAGFIDGFAALKPLPGTQIAKAADFFSPAMHHQIEDFVRAVPQQRLEQHELEGFGRHVVHDDAWFTGLQHDILGRVEEMAGRQLVPGYNFLSLYGGKGVCELHMDEPMSMYTLDYCISQSGPWPIHFSNLVDWPGRELMASWTPANVLDDPAITFTTHALQPNEALLFIGSSQWHYRAPITPGGFCNLLFFHYYPAGCDDLVRPRRWPAHFGLPELEPLIDLFAEIYADFP